MKKEDKILFKAKIKWINSLKLKKNRDEEGVFVAEGVKLVSELLPVLPCKLLVVTEGAELQKENLKAGEIVYVSPNEYKKVSFQKSPQGVLAVFEKPRFEPDFSELNVKLSLALDDVQDPGNLGTIIRTADWFGVENIYCSIGTADVYNPKVVQATMGAIARVKVHYVDLAHFLSSTGDEVPVYGTLMDGENIYQKELRNSGILLMGNEGKGISDELMQFVNERILIPAFPGDQSGSESLNVSVATGICLAEFRRKA